MKLTTKLCSREIGGGVPRCKNVMAWHGGERTRHYKKKDAAPSNL